MADILSTDGGYLLTLGKSVHITASSLIVLLTYRWLLFILSSLNRRQVNEALCSFVRDAVDVPYIPVIGLFTVKEGPEWLSKKLQDLDSELLASMRIES